MLKLALPYKESLDAARIDISFQEKYKYFNLGRSTEYTVNLKEDNWQQLEFVSVDNEDNVLGFMRANIDRHIHAISGLEIINFYNVNYIFSKDLRQFLEDLLLKFNFNKINFNVVIGNPAEKMYDKYIKRYGGRIVGIYENDAVLYDGSIHHVKLYEIHRKDFLKNVEPSKRVF